MKYIVFMLMCIFAGNSRENEGTYHFLLACGLQRVQAWYKGQIDIDARIIDLTAAK